MAEHSTVMMDIKRTVSFSGLLQGGVVSGTLNYNEDFAWPTGLSAGGAPTVAGSGARGVSIAVRIALA